MDSIFFALWFFAPGGVANMAPVLAANVPALKNLNHPMDFGKTFRDKRILGSHKTLRGLSSGVIAGFLTAVLQMVLVNIFPSISNITKSIDYTDSRVLVIGVLMGLGALIGDAVKSFFKRQIGVQPGKNWVPFDQTDFIIGGLVFTAPLVSFDVGTYFTILIVMTLLHPATNLLGWVLKLKSKPF